MFKCLFQSNYKNLTYFCCRRTLRQQAQERISQDLIVAFKKLREYIETNYLPKCRTNPSVGSLPGGDDYYKASLRYHTSTSLSAGDVHSLGLTHVSKMHNLLLQVILILLDSLFLSFRLYHIKFCQMIHFKLLIRLIVFDEIIQIAHEVGINKDDGIESMMSQLRKDESHYFTNAEEMMSVIRRTVNDVTLPLMTSLFLTLPPENLT